MATNLEALKDSLNNNKIEEAAVLLIGLCPVLKNCQSCDSCLMNVLTWCHKPVPESWNEKNCTDLTRLIKELQAKVEQQNTIQTSK